MAPRHRTAVIAALCSFAALVACSITALSLAAHADRTEGWRHAARYTARFSFALFLVVFVASPWHRLWPSAPTRWAVSYRRALGLAFATAHFIHLYALTRFRVASERMPNLGQLIGGGGAYVLLAAMAATSNDASVRALGHHRWKRLHTVGLLWIWFVFLETYAAGFAAGRPFYAPFAIAALAAFGLRIAAYLRSRSRPAA